MMIRAVSTSLACLCLLALAWTNAVFAQQPSQQKAAASTSPSATLRVMNRDIAVLRASFSGYGPAERADAASQRIAAIVERGGPGAVSATPVELFGQRAIRLDIDGRFALFVHQNDLSPESGETVESAGEAARGLLEQAVREAHELGSGERMLRGIGAALLATLAFVLLLRLAFWVRRRIESRLARAASRRAEQVKFQGVSAIKAEQVAAIVRRLVSIGTWIGVLVLAEFWLSFVLTRFPYTRAWGEHLESQVIDLLLRIGNAIVGALPGLAVVVIIVILTRVFLKLVSAFLRRVEAGEFSVGWLDVDTVGPTQKVFTAVVWLFAVAMAYPYLPGAGTEAFKGLSVLVGLMVSIGASGIIGQAMSGLSLMYSRALRQGEYVSIGETEGTVTAIGMFATKISTGNGEEISIPNAVIVGNPVKNFSRLVHGSGFVLHTNVTIGYDTPWRQVHAMLIEAARRTPGVLAEPPPFVVQTSLSDFYVEYKLCAVAGEGAPKRRGEAMSVLHANIQDVFNERGVQIMSPHYQSDPTTAKVVRDEEESAAPAEPPQTAERNTG